MTLTESARPRAEKQERIRVIAELMPLVDSLNLTLIHEMGHFSAKETAILNDATDMLEHFVRLASAQT